MAAHERLSAVAGVRFLARGSCSARRLLPDCGEQRKGRGQQERVITAGAQTVAFLLPYVAAGLPGGFLGAWQAACS